LTAKKLKWYHVSADTRRVSSVSSASVASVVQKSPARNHERLDGVGDSAAISPRSRSSNRSIRGAMVGQLPHVAGTSLFHRVLLAGPGARAPHRSRGVRSGRRGALPPAHDRAVRGRAPGAEPSRARGGDGPALPPSARGPRAGRSGSLAPS